MDLPGLNHTASLLIYALLAVIGLVILIARFKFHAFVALIIASLFLGICSGMKLPEIAKAFQEGVGGVLSFVAGVVGLGTILGKLLAESGGAEVVAKTLIRSLGERRLPWAMVFIALLIGIPTWFAVGLVLLVPILYTVARETKAPFLQLAIPIAAGLSIMHGLVPPHPGPMVAIETLKADTGKTILYSLLIGLPTAIIAGPIFGKWIARRVPVSPDFSTPPPSIERKNLPGFGVTVFTILFPVLLMLLATVADVTLPKENRLRQWMDFIGSPLVAMLLAVLFSLYTFGYARGFDRGRLGKFAEECLGPVASILLVVGAGGGFNKVLIYSGIGDAIASVAKETHLSPLLLGWLVAALIRVATGSATVAISTAAGIVAPLVASTPGVNLELLVIAMGAGSLILSHLNDGGFWFIKEYFQLTVPQTLKTWTVMETIVAVVVLVFVLALNALI